MNNSLIDRGPDAEGIYMSPAAALGHRRLVVVDPAGGAQPMSRSREGCDFTIVYNGELYNTAELRRELLLRGYIFESRNSDTEALLLAYMEWGPACVKKFNGIFAFAIWDESRQRVFLARDRLGVKPLFYTQKGSSLLFASQLKSLLVHPLVIPAIDGEGLAELLVMGPSRTPGHGVLQGIKELRPGHSMLYSRSGMTINRYWALESLPHEDDLAKGILRRALRGLLPEQVLTRPKSPYPKTHNPLYQSLMRQRINDILYDSSSPLLDIINPAALRKRLAASPNFMPEPWFGQLMGDAQYLAYLIQLNSWLKKYRIQIR